MKREYWIISLKNLKHRGLRSWLTLLGIFIGVMAVVALIGLGNGLKAAVNAQFGVSSTEVISVQAGGLNAYGPPGSGAVDPLTTDDLNAIRRVNNVEFALRRNIENGDLEYNDRRIFGYATNILYGEERKFMYEILDVKPLKGKLLEDKDEGKVVLGNNFYTDNVGLGKPVEVNDNIIIKGKRFEVIGILEKKGSFIFDNIVLMNDESLNDIMNYDDEIDIIAVKVKNKEVLEKTKEDIEEVMRKQRNVKEGQENFEVSTPQASLDTVNSVLLGIQIFIIMIAFISVFVGAIGIVNTMTTSVVERKREIGIMKAIGAKNSDIFYLFFIEAGLLGFIGGLIGVTLGTGITVAGIYGLNSFLGAELKPDINFLLIGITLLGSFVIGALSGIIPALRAAKENTVEAIRS